MSVDGNNDGNNTIDDDDDDDDADDDDDDNDNDNDDDGGDDSVAFVLSASAPSALCEVLSSCPLRNDLCGSKRII